MAAALTRIDKLLTQLNDALDDNKVDDENEVAKIDHIVYFVQDLESSIIKFTKLLGIKPMIGGRHTKWGSWNALFSLSNGVYFELLADDPKSSIEHKGFLKQLVSNKENGEGILTFMYRPPKKYNKNLEKYKSMIQNNCSYDPGVIFGGERTLENGKILKWDLMCPLKDKMEPSKFKIYQDGLGVIGICIDWKIDDFGIHPSNTTPKGTSLLSLTCYHPNATDLASIINNGIKMEKSRFRLEKGDKVKFELKLKTVSGETIVLN